MSRYTMPVTDLKHAQWKHAATAMQIAEALAGLCFDHSLPFLDPETRGRLMQLADEAVASAVDEHALADVVEIDSCAAWKARIET